MNNANTPINPILNSEGEVAEMSNGEILSGLTKREYFAGLAMQGLSLSGESNVDIANQSVDLADALLKQLEDK